MVRLPLLLTTLVLATALAGCSGGGSEDLSPADGDDGAAPGPSGGSGGSGVPAAPQAPVELPVLYLNGTITGAVDCQLAAQGGTVPAGPQSSTSVSVPAEAAGRSYSLELGASGLPQDPGAASVCLSWDGGATWSTASSGTVPDEASEVLVAADTAYEHAFTIRIE